MRIASTSPTQALVVAIACAALFACGDRGSEPARVEAGDLALEASLRPASPRVGENQLALELRDATGAPVAGAHMSIDVRMHAMGAMPAMGGPARVRELGDGRYQAEFGLEMGGTWQVAITAHSPSGTALRAEGSLSVGSEGIRLAAVTGPADDASAPDELSGAREGAESPGAFAFPVERLQKIGVRTARAEVRALARTLRATARVVFDETALVDVSPRTSGWLESLAVAGVGEPVVRGQTLFTLYGPDLYAAQLELQQALASRARAQASTREERANALVRAAERRLALLGVAPADIAAIAKRSEPLAALPMRAPASGIVVEKDAVVGAAVEAGQRLLRIAPDDRVWLEAAIAEADLPLVREGAPVRVRLAGQSEALRGRVTRVLPQLAAESRTGSARIALDSPGIVLLPGTWASVELDSAAGDALVVPSGAVLRTGERSFVFLARGGGRFEPREVTLGFETPDALEIRSGLAAGDEVVSEGTYLIASESRLRAAMDQW